MGKKPSPPSKNVQVGESSKLTHNPFAALTGAGSPGADAPAAPTASGSAASAPQDAPTGQAPRRGRLVLARETKHRGGKAVVVVRGFDKLQGWDADAVEQLATELKRALGCGGTVEEAREIVVQGDRPAQVAEWLRRQGFRVEGVTS